MTEELAEYLRQFRVNRVEAETLCSALSAGQFNWRPAPGRWSVAECLVHLIDGAHAFLQQIQVATNRARERGQVGTGPFTYGPWSRSFLRSMEPPVRKRYKSLRRYSPSPKEQYDVSLVLEGFRAVGAEWERCLDEADGLHLARVKVRHPAIPLLRFQLGALFAGMAAHERRHLWQAKEIKRCEGFPSTGEQ